MKETKHVFFQGFGAFGGTTLPEEQANGIENKNQNKGNIILLFCPFFRVFPLF